MISNFLKKTAVIKRLSTATKVKRTLTTGASVSVTEPQGENVMDLVSGVHVTRYVVYCAKDTDIVRGDRLTIDSTDYDVVEIVEQEMGNIDYKKLITLREE